MNYSCGNCKHLKYDKERLYPYRCRYERGASLTEQGLEDRIKSGIKCDKYEFGFGTYGKEDNE